MSSPLKPKGAAPGYTYDNIHRLGTSVATGSSAHNLTFSYDRHGNMSCVTNQNTHGPCPNYTFNASTNQINNSGYTYDAAGNLTADGTGTGTHSYQWDAENRLKSIDNGSTATYTYNALGQRVEKNVGGSYTEYVYHASGEEVAENNRSIWPLQVIPFTGRHVAHYQSSATYFNHNTSIGTTSQVTDYTGAIAQDQLYYPWGQEWNMVGTAQEKRFARLGHRDTTETGLDPTLFRMFSATQGRWLSKDPKTGKMCNPQTMNRYAYVRNNPPSRTDPLGADDCLGGEHWMCADNNGFGTYYGPGNPGNGCQVWDASCGGAHDTGEFGAGLYTGFNNGGAGFGTNCAEARAGCVASCAVIVLTPCIIGCNEAFPITPVPILKVAKAACYAACAAVAGYCYIDCMLISFPECSPW